MEIAKKKYDRTMFIYENFIVTAKYYQHKNIEIEFPKQVGHMWEPFTNGMTVK